MISWALCLKQTLVVCLDVADLDEVLHGEVPVPRDGQVDVTGRVEPLV